MVLGAGAASTAPEETAGIGAGEGSAAATPHPASAAVRSALRRKASPAFRRQGPSSIHLKIRLLLPGLKVTTAGRVYYGYTTVPECPTTDAELASSTSKLSTRVRARGRAVDGAIVWWYSIP